MHKNQILQREICIFWAKFGIALKNNVEASSL